MKYCVIVYSNTKIFQKKAEYVGLVNASSQEEALNKCNIKQMNSTQKLFAVPLEEQCDINLNFLIK